MPKVYQCEVCNRTFKNKLGLVSHGKVCKPLEVSTSDKDEKGIESIVEVAKEPCSVMDGVIEAMDNINSELQRRLDRLKYDIRNCYDASTRYRLECEYFELGGTRDSLNK